MKKSNNKIAIIEEDKNTGLQTPKVFEDNFSADKNSKSKTFDFSTLLKPLLYFVFAILLEVINFVSLDFYHASSINFGLFPKYFLLDIGILLIFTGIIYLAQKKVIQNILFYLLLGLQIFINMINGSLFNKQGIFFSFDLLSLVGGATTSFSWQFIDFASIILNIIFLVVIIVVQITFDAFASKKFVTKKVKKLPIFLALFVGYSGLGFSAYFTQRSLFSEDIQLLYESKYSYPSMMYNFGTMGLMVNEIASIIIPEDKDKYIGQILANVDSGKTELNSDAPLYGDNLIVLMLESFDKFVIDPYNTPTLYNIMNNSVYMDNFLSNNKTNISEILAFLGYQPNSLSLTLKSDSGLATKYSLPNLFNDLGYTTNYFHSYDLTMFYSRNTTNVRIGFENVTGLESVNLPDKRTSFGDFNLETEFLNAVIDDLAPTDGSKFFSFYLTVATHGDYNNHPEKFDKFLSEYDSNLENMKKYWEEETDFIYPEDSLSQKYLRELKSRAIDTDNMVELLLNHLNETGLIENTTLIIYADHNAYFDNLAYLVKGTSATDYSNINSYTVPFMIYNKKLESQKIDSLCTTADIYSTVCDLYGLPYNTFMCQGRSVFDETQTSFVWSFLTGYYSDKFYSSDGMNVIKIDPNATDEELAEFKTRLKQFINKELLLDKTIKYDIKV